MSTQRVPAIVDQRVKVNNNAGVDHSDVDLTKGHDQVVWQADDATTIAFETSKGSPFTWQTHSIAAGASFASGLVRGDADEGPYKYTVYVGSKKNDPTVIVHN